MERNNRLILWDIIPEAKEKESNFKKIKISRIFGFFDNNWRFNFANGMRTEGWKDWKAKMFDFVNKINEIVKVTEVDYWYDLE